MARLRCRLEVEPLIYKLLVPGGAVDPEGVRRDLAASAFSTVLLFEDVHQKAEQDLEMPTLPAGHTNLSITFPDHTWLEFTCTNRLEPQPH